MPAGRAKETRSDAFAAAAELLVADFQAQRPLRTGSLIISVFGDAIAPHGGAVWLGSLIEVLKPFGINQRLVRTSVFRLVREAWLQSEQIGRRSYYRITQRGRARFHDASRHIYSEPRRDWDGSWCLVMLAGVDADRREEFRRELGWFGFAPFSPNVMAHPAPDLSRVEDKLAEIEGNGNVLVMHATASSSRSRYLNELVHQSWSLQELDDRYAAFLDRFRVIYKEARACRTLEPETAFRVRTLLIHEYRKILLRDPFLPDELLPARWNGVPAYQLCRNLYSLVAVATERFLTERMETADGPLPPADPAFFQRFGGLQ